MPRGACRQLVLLQQDDVRLAQARKMERKAATGDAAADDGYSCLCEHGLRLTKLWAAGEAGAEADGEVGKTDLTIG